MTAAATDVMKTCGSTVTPNLCIRFCAAAEQTMAVRSLATAYAAFFAPTEKRYSSPRARMLGCFGETGVADVGVGAGVGFAIWFLL